MTVRRISALVFGKTGQVARELAANVPESWTLTLLDRQAADLTDPQACAAAIAGFTGDIVLNAAAYTGVDAAESDRETAFLVNGGAPGAMAQACAAKRIPFIHLSTDYVFAGGQGSRPHRPEDKTAPLAVYGASKAKGEAAVVAAGGQSLILRVSWVFSAHGKNFVKTMLALSETRSELNIVSDQIGGPTAAADIARAVFVIGEAMLGNTKTCGIYHFAGAPDISWADFAREIFSQTGREVQVTDIPASAYPTPAPRPLNSRLDCASLEQDFALARPDWRIGLRNVLTALGEIR